MPEPAPERTPPDDTMPVAEGSYEWYRRKLERHEDLLASIVLYIDWRYVTRQLTTDQKELFADSLERDALRAHGPNGEEPDPEMARLPSYAPRWWRPDYVEADRDR